MYLVLLLLCIVVTGMSTSDQYSSGFQSMLGSPTTDHDMWSNLQDLEHRIEHLEQSAKPGFERSFHYERSRHDSASSSGTTVIDSSHVTSLPPDGQLQLENNLTLTDATLNNLKKFSKVQIKIAVIGTELRGPEECTCSHVCNEPCQNGKMQDVLDRLTQQIEMLTKENRDLKNMLSSGDGLVEEAPIVRSTWNTTEAPQDQEDDENTGVVEYSEETSKAHIEELKTSHKERTQKFSIRSVVDPKTKKMISLDDAIAEKIVQLEKGIYFNSVTGERIPIADAMKSRLIAVDTKTTRWSNLRETSVGLMTIQKNICPSSTLLVKDFKDTTTGQMVSKKTAIQRGITDGTLGSFNDLQTGETLNILQAIERGLVTVDSENTPQPEMTRCIYKVSGVLDKRTNEVISFKEALTRRLLVTENSMCKDTSSGKYIFIGFALLSGIVQVDPIESTDLEAIQW